VTDKPKHKRPIAEKMDERLVMPLDPEKLVEGILHAGAELRGRRSTGRTAGEHETAQANDRLQLALGVHDHIRADGVRVRCSVRSRSRRGTRIDNIMETTDGAVVVQTTEHGTHAGTWRSVPPTGRPVEIEICDILRFDDQYRIVSNDYYADHLSILQQLGVLDPSDWR
jgi:hypothetical protein